MGVELTGHTLTIAELVDVARYGARIDPLSGYVRERMRASSDWVNKAVSKPDASLYGVNTGFGPLATEKVDAAALRKLSRNVVLACLTGVGEPLPIDVVRAMMACRANTFALGTSGVRPVLAHTLIEMLNAGVVPYVPAKGSLGASGDLAPQAHIAVVLSQGPDGTDDGHSGQAWYQGELLTGAEAMAKAGIRRVSLEAKEGLALTNGTALMVAMGALGLHDARMTLQQAEIAAALSIEALLGLSEPFRPPLHEANRQAGQIRTAEMIRKLIAGSRFIDSLADKVQDAYSLRCTPQILGPVHDVVDFLHSRLHDAIVASADNPLIFAPPENPSAGFAISGGNFHGQGLAMWLDYLGIAMSVVGNVAERRIFRLTTPELSDGLPAMLVRKSGLDSGLMVPQYTAAALVSENKALAHPSSVDSIPTSGNQEDFVSMGANAARQMAEIVQNVRHIVAIEMITAAQAVDLRAGGPNNLGKGTRTAYEMIRQHTDFVEHDRPLDADIERVASLIQSGDLLASVHAAIGDAA